jgi:protein-disulfide isomerase
MQSVERMSLILGWFFLLSTIVVMALPGNPARALLVEWNRQRTTRTVLRENWTEVAQGRPVLGSAPAPSAIAFMDYRCPYCRAGHDSLTILLKDNPELAVRIRYLPSKARPMAREAAHAAICAAEQDGFAALNDYLMSDTTWTGSSTLSEAVQVTEVRSLTEWESCMASDRPEEVLAADSSWAERLGVDATPFFLSKTGESARGLISMIALRELLGGTARQ